MLYSSPCLEIKSEEFIGAPALEFYFKGKLSLDVSRQATAAWSQFIEENAATSYLFIWDCTEMTGFEIAARREWLSALVKTIGHIKKVIIISDNMLIRGSARLMLKLLNVQVEIYKSNEEVMISPFGRYLA